MESSAIDRPSNNNNNNNKNNNKNKNNKTVKYLESVPFLSFPFLEDLQVESSRPSYNDMPIALFSIKSCEGEHLANLAMI